MISVVFFPFISFDFPYKLCFSVVNRLYVIQFLPQDFNKVMVTCGDSQVRIVEGLNVVSKFKGILFCSYIFQEFRICSK